MTTAEAVGRISSSDNDGRVDVDVDLDEARGEVTSVALLGSVGTWARNETAAVQ